MSAVEEHGYDLLVGEAVAQHLGRRGYDVIGGVAQLVQCLDRRHEAGVEEYVVELLVAQHAGEQLYLHAVVAVLTEEARCDARCLGSSQHVYVEYVGGHPTAAVRR